MNCAGSFNLIKKLGIVKKESAAMASGTKIHLALETHNYEGLTKSEVITADRIAEKEAKMVDRFGLENAKIIREERFWLEYPFVGKVFSAKPDVVYMTDDVMVCANYKTGWGEQKDIEHSWQVVSEICSIQENIKSPAKKFVGVLISPNAPNFKYQEIVLTDEEVVAKTDAIKEGMVTAINADPDNEDSFVAGDVQCQWCPAKPACPKHSKAIPASIVKLEAYYGEIYKDKLIEKIEAMTPQERGVAYSDLTVVEGVIKAGKDRLKELIKKREVDGYISKPTKTLEITDTIGTLESARIRGIYDLVASVRLTDLDKNDRKAFEESLVKTGLAEYKEGERITKVKE
jgi:hypothetical protein